MNAKTSQTPVERTTRVEDLLCAGVKIAEVTVHYLPEQAAMTEAPQAAAENDPEARDG